MRLLKRLLGDHGCGNSGRGGGSRRHLESCPACRARQARERQYLQRLRGAAIPKASDDLTARLLARTEQLAAELPTAPPSAPPAPPQAPRHSRKARLPALAAGGAAAAAALTAAAAYLLGGPAAPPAEGAGNAAFLRQHPAGSAVAWDPERDAVPAGSGWALTGAPDFTPDGALSAGQLAALRSQGWACPELRELDFHLIWARGGALDGGNVLELRLTDGRHFVTVLEQRGPRPAAAGTVRDRQPPVPVNVLTGHPATADGFTAAGGSGGPGGSGSGSGTLWINAAAPFRAIYQTAGATFTYIADLPAERAGDAVAALMRTGAGIPAGPPAPAGISERMERGLGRILQLLAP